MEVCVVVTLNVRGKPQPRTAKITKVGRKWITLEDADRYPTRFDAKTHRIDGGQYSSPGRVYASKEEYRETTEKQDLWRNFCSRLPLTAPEHISIFNIENIILDIWPVTPKKPN